MRLPEYLCRLLLGRLHSGGVVAAVEVRLDLQTCAGGGGCDEFKYCATGGEQFASSLYSDEAEHAVLDRSMHCPQCAPSGARMLRCRHVVKLRSFTAASPTKGAVSGRSSPMTSVSPVQIMCSKRLRRTQCRLVGRFVDTLDPGIDNDFVPLGGAGRSVADVEDQVDIGSESDRVSLERLGAASVAPCGVGGDQQLGGAGLAGNVNAIGPAGECRHRELRGVLIVVHVDPAQVGVDIEHPIGDGLSDLSVGEVLDTDSHRLSLLLPFLTRVGVGADALLPLRIGTDNQPADGEMLAGSLGDVAELPDTDGPSPPGDLGSGLQAAAPTVQQSPNQVHPHLATRRSQLASQELGRLGHRAQWRHRIIARLGFGKRVEHHHKITAEMELACGVRPFTAKPSLRDQASDQPLGFCDKRLAAYSQRLSQPRLTAPSDCLHRRSPQQSPLRLVRNGSGQEK